MLAQHETVAEVDFSAFTYLRYLNQRTLDDSYTDAFGRTKDTRHPGRPAAAEGHA